jgi:hypothetical protein
MRILRNFAFIQILSASFSRRVQQFVGAETGKHKRRQRKNSNCFTERCRQ